jgi:type IV pilus assembly protein PilX
MMKTHLARSQQKGVALITVMVILLLSIIAVLAASRTTLLNEALVGNMSDYNRALAAAEALIRDAEIDVRGRLPNGYLCREDIAGTDVPTANFVGCRDTAVGPFIPEGTDFDDARDAVLVTAAAPAATPCSLGVCFPASLATLSTLEDNLGAMAARGVRYGFYTRGAIPLDLGDATNSILRGAPAAVTDPNQGWYWIEVFQYAKDAPTNRPGEVIPGGKAPLIFRITAVALGQKAGTRAIVRSFFVPKPKCGGPEPCTTGA